MAVQLRLGDRVQEPQADAEALPFRKDDEAGIGNQLRYFLFDESLIPLVPLDQHLVRSMVELHGDAEERSESRLRRLTSVEAEHEFVEIAL